jgi:Transcriptional repressor TCF25
MSHRALRRMRQEREPQLVVADDESEDEDDVGATQNTRTINAFAMINDSSSSDDDDDDDDDDDSNASSFKDDKNDKEKKKISPSTKLTSSVNYESTTTEVQDLDALLQEYRLKDKTEDIHTDKSNNTVVSSSSLDYYSIITAGMDPRDLDIDHVMRTSLLGNTTSYVTTTSSKTRLLSRRGNYQIFLFGPPKEEWPRPPHYVGGGIGMVSYDDWNQDESNTPLSTPYPYSDLKENDEWCPPTSQWFKFSFSDSYQRDLQDYETIQASGDANTLAMFVAHHPFIVPALLQLSEVLYQTRQHQEGLSMLKRSLWVLECAALNSFLKMDGPRKGFLSYELEENQPFFDAVCRLMRISYMGGLARTALAASRLLLSLDPLLDPKNVLLCMDHFVLACNTESCDQWLVKLVESNQVSWFFFFVNLLHNGKLVST